MQVLIPGQYQALDSKSRRPCARVFVQQAKESIPFEGKIFNSTTTNEKYPFCIEHSTGRAVVVYSKYNSYDSKYEIYFKASDIYQELWETPVKIIYSASYDYINPTCVQILSSNNIGIVVSQAGYLYSKIVTVTGASVTSLTNLSITGNTPCLCKVGSTYWLTYEAGGILYYRTSFDFVTWSAATNLNTKTGLSNSHYSPYLYYDVSNKLWLCFERVTDIVSSPNVTNVYYMISTNQGSTWASPVAQTTLAAGEGSCYKPSIVDTGSYRYYSYVLQQQIQNYNYGSGQHQFLKYDLDNDRVLFIVGTGFTNNKLVILNRVTGLYNSFTLSSYGMTAGLVQCLDYDSVNNTIVIGTSANGLIIYNENTTTWSIYNTITTPAIIANNILSLRIKGNKIYYHGFTGSPSYNYCIGLFDLSALTATTIQNPTTHFPTYYVMSQIFISSSFITVFVHSSSDGSGLYYKYPNITVIDASNNTVLYNTNIGYGTSYDLMHTLYDKNRLLTYDEDNNYIYSLATDTGASNDYGIIKYQVGTSVISLIRYYSNAIGNIFGLLPNPDIAYNKISAIQELTYADNILYIQSFTLDTSTANKDEYCIQVFDLVSEIVTAYYAPSDADDFAANFPSIDALFSKILLPKVNIPSTTASFIIANDFGEVFFASGANPNYYITILQTSSEANRVYYRRTSNDITWDVAVYLTSLPSDDFVKLVMLDSKLSAFWTRSYTGIYEIYWDEDLGAEIEITNNVVSCTITKNDGNKSNTANIVIEDKLRIYHPLNYNSLKYNILKENNIIRIEKGNNENYNPAFYGHIGSGDSEDIRGSDVFYGLEVYDRSKMFYRQKQTSIFFEDKTICYIASYIAANYMNLDVAEYASLSGVLVNPTTDTIHQVQFIDEYPMDMLLKLYQSRGYFVVFDEEGNLILKKYNYDANVDFTYYQDGMDTVAANKAPAMNIVSFGFNWNDDELVNQVKVTGETEEVYETVFDEEYMGNIQGTSGWFSKSQTFTYYFSDDKLMKCVEPRLNIKDSCGNRFFGGGESISFTPGSGEHGENIYCTINQNVSNLISTLYVLIAGILICSILYGFGIGGGWGVTYVHVITWNPMAAVLAMAVTILGQIGSYNYEIYAKPVGEPLPEAIPAVANDIDLQNIYGGIVSKEIENPFLNTYDACLALAEDELAKSKWFRYILTIKILANPGIQIGDVIQIFNPNTNLSYKVYITDISQSFSRGNEDVDILKGGLIQ